MRPMHCRGIFMLRSQHPCRGAGRSRDRSDDACPSGRLLSLFPFFLSLHNHHTPFVHCTLFIIGTHTVLKTFENLLRQQKSASIFFFLNYFFFTSNPITIANAAQTCAMNASLCCCCLLFLFEFLSRDKKQHLERRLNPLLPRAISA